MFDIILSLIIYCKQKLNYHYYYYHHHRTFTWYNKKWSLNRLLMDTSGPSFLLFIFYENTFKFVSWKSVLYFRCMCICSFKPNFVYQILSNCLFVWGFTPYQRYFSYLTATVHESMFPGLFLTSA